MLIHNFGRAMRVEKLILGTFTFLPIPVYIIFFIAFFSPREIRLGILMNPFFIGVFTISNIVAGFLVSHYLDLLTDATHLSPSEKKRWINMFYFFNIFATPFYFYKYIWKDNRPRNDSTNKDGV